MKDTIKSTNGGYSVRYGERKTTKEKVVMLYDGMERIMVAKLRSIEDYNEEEQYNECFMFFEKFTTRQGNEFIYWTDTETGEDYLTKITVELWLLVLNVDF